MKKLYLFILLLMVSLYGYSQKQPNNLSWDPAERVNLEDKYPTELNRLISVLNGF